MHGGSASTIEQADIGIIGAGIAGAALAAALADSGLRVALFDRREGLLDTARGDHIQPSLIPVLSRWGVLEQLHSAGAEQRVGTRWFDAQQQPIVTVGVPPTVHTPPWFLFLNHELIGEALLKGAARGDTDVILGIDHWHLARDGSAWRIDFLQNGHERSLRCTLLVGADGTGSSVRKKLGIQVHRHRYQYPIAVLYGRLAEQLKERTLDVYLCHERMLSVIPRTGGWSKIGVPIDAAELAGWRDSSSDELTARLQRWCPVLDFEQLSFGAIYPPISLQTEPFVGEGAALLLGDACHAMHPARSQGMNTCFRVADQLATAISSLPSGFSETAVLPLIKQFDAAFRVQLTPRLAENHAAGLQMDTLSGGGFVELTEQLRGAAQNPEILDLMAHRAAGLTP